jgi:hypothetical protein
MGPSGKIKTPDASNLRAVSHASERNGKGAVAFETTLGVTGDNLDGWRYRTQRDGVPNTMLGEPVRRDPENRENRDVRIADFPAPPCPHF